MTVPQRTRILIVDDSAVMRSLLRAVVTSDPHLEVAGTAADGASALTSLPAIQPDVILLDVEMPVMDGLATLRALRQRWSRVPVIMCSSLTQRGAKVTIEALAFGAADYVAKPSGQADREAAIRTLAQELIPKIHALTKQVANTCSATADSREAESLSHLKRIVPLDLNRVPAGPASLAPAPLAVVPQQITSTPSIVVIGVSTGGPAALDVILPRLPDHFPLPVLIVQHMPELFTHLLAERLNIHCRLRVREASEGDPVRAGTIYIARGNWHMETVAAASIGAHATLRLNQGPQENHCRPAVDVLFRTAASVYGSGVLAVVLTGMGADGLEGCRRIREMYGTVLAQDEATSTVWGMPGAVAKAGLAHRVIPLDMVAPEILRITAQSTCLPASLGQDRGRQAVT